MYKWCTANGPINAHFQINLLLSNQRPPTLLNCIRRPSLISAPGVIDAAPPIAHPFEYCSKIKGNGEMEQNQFIYSFHCLINNGLCTLSCSIFKFKVRIALTDLLKYTAYMHINSAVIYYLKCLSNENECQRRP